MESFELNFKGGNPGAVQYGNFINYYKFHPPEERLKLLPSNIWPKCNQYHILDLGSNAGDLTIELSKYLQNKECYSNILGIDIDPVLVQRANEKVENVETINFHCLDIMDEKSRPWLRNYLQGYNITKFDAVFCFSITMWIHLNYGDDGLQKFLKLIADFGNLIIIEPQPWKCYKSAVKRMKSSSFTFPLFQTIKIRQTVEEEIEKFLKDNCSTSKIYESESSNWGRKIQVFKDLTDT